MSEKQLVYIVEDDASIRELEIYALKNSEFEVKGFESGKSFWYQVEYMDGVQKVILNTYDVNKNEILQINGKKAVYCKYNDIVGSQYNKDQKPIMGRQYIFLLKKKGIL